MIGSQDLLLALAIGIFFFGAKRLPELSRSLGRALTEFKKGLAGDPPDTAGPIGAATPPSAAAPPPAKDAGHPSV